MHLVHIRGLLGNSACSVMYADLLPITEQMMCAYSLGIDACQVRMFQKIIFCLEMKRLICAVTFENFLQFLIFVFIIKEGFQAQTLSNNSIVVLVG